jgi:hypothetical protein
MMQETGPKEHAMHLGSTEHSVWLPGKESLDSSKSLGQPWLMDPYKDIISPRLYFVLQNMLHT